MSEELISKSEVIEALKDMQSNADIEDEAWYEQIIEVVASLRARPQEPGLFTKRLLDEIIDSILEGSDADNPTLCLEEFRDSILNLAPSGPLSDEPLEGDWVSRQKAIDGLIELAAPPDVPSALENIYDKGVADSIGVVESLAAPVSGEGRQISKEWLDELYEVRRLLTNMAGGLHFEYRNQVPAWLEEAREARHRLSLLLLTNNLSAPSAPTVAPTAETLILEQLKKYGAGDVCNTDGTFSDGDADTCNPSDYAAISALHELLLKVRGQ